MASQNVIDKSLNLKFLFNNLPKSSCNETSDIVGVKVFSKNKKKQTFLYGSKASTLTWLDFWSEFFNNWVYEDFAVLTIWQLAEHTSLFQKVYISKKYVCDRGILVVTSSFKDPTTHCNPVGALTTMNGLHKYRTRLPFTILSVILWLTEVARIIVSSKINRNTTVPDKILFQSQ